MQAYEALQARGFAPPSLLLDGKIHRWSRESKRRNAWYIGWLHHLARTGEAVEVIQFGDWKTGERYDWTSRDQIPKEDQTAIRKKMAEHAREQEEEREKLAADAADRSERDWARTQDTVAPYAERKKVPMLGARSVLGPDGRAVFVPMRDIDGKMRGRQLILPDGQRFFMTGQPTKGLLCWIGEPTGARLLVAEGWATAVTLHQATELPVAIAFSAWNMREVVREIRRRYPLASVTVCGDDDWSVKHPQTKEPWNPGREGADSAVAIAGSPAIFPTFTVADRGTDFNDLYLLEGIERVRDQVLGAPAPAPSLAVLPLGYSSSDGYVYLTRAPYPRLVKMGAARHTKLGLLNLAPASYWETLFPTDDGFDANQAADDLMRTARERGQFQPEKVRGSGAWADEEGRLVLNLGDRVVGGGTEAIYVGMNKLELEMERPLSVEEMRPLFSLVSQLSFAEPNRGAALLMGWLVIAPLAGALPFRPHLLMTAEPGSGKSAIIHILIARLFGTWLPRVALGGSSESGIRQAAERCSLPIIADDIDTEDESGNAMVQQILRLARISSFRAATGAVLKGSVDGEPQAFRCDSCFAIGAVRSPLEASADLSRWVQLELTDAKLTAEEYQKFEAKMRSVLTPEFSRRFVGRVVRNFGVLEKSIQVLLRALQREMTPREAQLYAPVLAGLHLALNDTPITEADVHAVVEHLGLVARAKENRSPEWQQALSRLLDWRIACAGSHDLRSVHTLLTAEGIDPAQRDQYLQEHGMRSNEEGFLLVNARHPTLDLCYRGTPWAKSYSTLLRRIPGATYGERVYFGGVKANHRVRCVRIPIS